MQLHPSLHLHTTVYQSQKYEIDKIEKGRKGGIWKGKQKIELCF